MNVQPLIDAIDRYLAKADDELEDTLKAEGFIEPKKTVKEANAVEEEMADILSEQTEDLLDVLDNSTEDNLQSNVDAMLEADDIAEVVAETSLTLYESLVPALANAYMQEAEGDLVINTLRQRTTDWFNSWSEQLGELTKISTHKQISDLIKKAIEDGISIDKLAKQIRQGGWRSEYYQARRYALTEVLRAHSVAREEAIQQSPSTDRKEWRHTGAHKIKPRANHVAMDKQIVPKEEPFEMQGSDGGTYFPMFPRDPSLPACESINCHCIHRGVVNDDILGLSKEERQKMQDEFVAADDGEWKKQLDTKNKSKAGIDVHEETLSFGGPSASDQKYAGVEYDPNDTASISRGQPITATRVVTAKSKLYVSESVTLKPRAMHNIDNGLQSVFEKMGIADSDNLPRIVVLSDAEFGTTAAASYNAIENIMYVRASAGSKKAMKALQTQFACPKEYTSTFAHEMHHWQDAESYRATVGDITNDDENRAYRALTNGIGKKKLEKLAKSGYDLSTISPYASRSLQPPDVNYDEAYTEYRVKLLLGE